MIHQELLRRAVPESNKVLTNFVETLAPKILTYFAAVPALGGSGKLPVIPGLEVPAGLQAFAPKDYANFSKLPDQSMATHLLNGIFAAMRLTEKLPPNKALTDDGKRLWILGYICHDYTKIYGVKIAAGDIPLIRQLIERLGELLDFKAFQADWKDYLGDIAFLSQNTQTKEGSNLYTSLFNVKADQRVLDTMRLLSSIADVLVHVKSPAEAVISPDRPTDKNIYEKMVMLFGAERAPRLAYHKLTEVRGLLSNIINNAVMQALKEQGCEPFLFFPNGVVYLTAPGIKLAPSIHKLVEKVWVNLTEILTSDEEIGIKRSGTGMKVNPAIYELVDFQTLMRIGQKTTLRIANSKALDKFTEAQLTKGDLVTDVRTDQLAEFIIFLKRRIFEKLFPKSTGFEEMFLAELGLSGKVSIEETRVQSGGVLLGWWYVAALYVAKHRSMDDIQLAEVMDKLRDASDKFVREKGLTPSIKSALVDSFANYLQANLEINGIAQIGEGAISLRQEFSQYLERKEKNKPVCSMCSTPYESIQQPETIVLFKPQQYTNKIPLGSSKMPPRGICPICTIELMLRTVQQGSRGKDFQDKKPIYFWIYPTYFFTTETAQVVRSYILQLCDLNFFELRAHLQKNGFTASALLDFPGFVVRDSDDHAWGIVRQEYDQHDLSTLFSFAIKPYGKKDKEITDTDSWVIPAFYALALPLLLDVKVVVTTSFVPLFANGAEFNETAVLDAPHQFTRHALGKDRFRVDELPDTVIRLLRLYDLHLDVFAERNDMHWPQLNAIAKDIVTDPNYTFYYYDHKRRKENAQSDYLSLDTIERYLQIYQTFGGQKDMGLIGKLVDTYAAFYRGKPDSAYSVLKPIAEVADAVIDSDPKTEKDDLLLLVAGAIGDLMERVWNNQADGWDPLVMQKTEQGYLERRETSRQKQMEFARLFVEEAFYGYCNGDRGLLRERLNRMRAAARFYYLSKYAYKKETNNG